MFRTALFVSVVLAFLVVAQGAAAKDKRVPPLEIGMPIVTQGKPVEVSPEKAASVATQPGWTTQGDLSAGSPMFNQPSCAIDPDTGGCMGSGNDAWDYEDDGSDGTLGTYDYSPKHCWFWTLSVEWAFWPIQGRISNDTLWCSMYYTYMTSRSSHVRLGSTLCGTGGAQVYRIGGGIGQWNIDVRATGSWTCPAKWIWIHEQKWMDTRWTAGGGADYLGWA